MKNFVVNLNECVRLSCITFVAERFGLYECVRLSHITFVAERFGLFAVRLPSLPRGNGLGLWHNF